MRNGKSRIRCTRWYCKQGSKFLILMLVLMSVFVFAQPSYKSYGLENDEANVIQNSGHLDDFFEHLYQLKTNGKTKINIVHIGDSHIQADYLTATVRANFQRDFGDAGRGLVVPFRVAGTNEPANFITSSSSVWEAKRCSYPNQPLPIGIGGVTISTSQPGASLSLKMNDPFHDYSFNTFTLFFLNNSNSFHFSIKDSTSSELAFLGNHANEPFVNYSRVNFPYAVNQITIESQKTVEEQTHATIFGINLENGKDGILYHAIGVNGAKYAHYNAALYFSKQTQALQPELFIISLGTNEALNYPYVDRTLNQQINELILSLQKCNPQAKFILVTPPSTFRKKVRANPGIELVRQQIIQYAAENGLAFWDMYKAVGGKGSAIEWKRKGLLRPDGVHFSKDGYLYQGDLLYYAIMKSYNQYVFLRHPETSR